MEVNGLQQLKMFLENVDIKTTEHKGSFNGKSYTTKVHHWKAELAPDGVSK